MPKNTNRLVFVRCAFLEFAKAYKKKLIIISWIDLLVERLNGKTR